MTVTTSLSCDDLGATLEHSLLEVFSLYKDERTNLTIDTHRAVDFLEGDSRDIQYAFDGLCDQGYLVRENGRTMILIDCFHSFQNSFQSLGTNGSFGAGTARVLKSSPTGLTAARYVRERMRASECPEGARRAFDFQRSKATNARAGAMEATKQATKKPGLVASNGAGPIPKKSIPSKNPTNLFELTRLYFPRICREAGFGLTNNSGALGANIKRWHISLERVRLMMDTFVQHPEWVKGKPAWRIFLNRADQLLQMTEQLTKDRLMEERRGQEERVLIPWYAQKRLEDLAARSGFTIQ